MIAGTDLAARTIDPADTLAFLGGGLALAFHWKRSRPETSLEVTDEGQGPGRPISRDRILLSRQNMGTDGIRGPCAERQSVDGFTRVFGEKLRVHLRTAATRSARKVGRNSLYHRPEHGYQTSGIHHPGDRGADWRGCTASPRRSRSSLRHCRSRAMVASCIASLFVH